MPPPHAAEHYFRRRRRRSRPPSLSCAPDKKRRVSPSESLLARDAATPHSTPPSSSALGSLRPWPPQPWCGRRRRRRRRRRCCRRVPHGRGRHDSAGGASAARDEMAVPRPAHSSPFRARPQSPTLHERRVRPRRHPRASVVVIAAALETRRAASELCWPRRPPLTAGCARDSGRRGHGRATPARRH